MKRNLEERKRRKFSGRLEEDKRQEERNKEIREKRKWIRKKKKGERMGGKE
jgi:hypothetical protein